MRQFLHKHANGKGRFFCWPQPFSIGFSEDESLLSWEQYLIHVKVNKNDLASAIAEKEKSS